MADGDPVDVRFRKPTDPPAKTAGRWSGTPGRDDEPSAGAIALSAKIAKSNTTPPVAAPPAQSPAVTPEGRTRAYQLALSLSSRVFTIVELAAMERYFVRDRLEKLSMSLPHEVLFAQQYATQRERIRTYQRALHTAREILSVIDILGERGTIEPEAVVDGRAIATELVAVLTQLSRWR